MEDISKNLGKCFKQDIGVGAYYYCKIVQILPRNHDKYKMLIVCGKEIYVDYYTFLKDSDQCSTEEFDEVYNKVINGELANKVIY